MWWKGMGNDLFSIPITAIPEKKDTNHEVNKRKDYWDKSKGIAGSSLR